MAVSDQYRFDGGYRLTPEGEVYEDLERFIQVGLLEFCGCGSPELSLEYIRVGLRLIDSRSPPEGLSLSEYLERSELGYNQWAAECSKHFGSDGARYFFFYWLDSKGYIEHGSSVPGWLTDSGKHLLVLLEEFKAETEENDPGE